MTRTVRLCGAAIVMALAASAGVELTGGDQKPSPPAALYAQYCASCHGPTLQGGVAASLVDDEWKHGADDASIMKVVMGGVPGTPMLPFKGILDDVQFRQILYYIRQQAAAARGKPALKVDPDGQIIKTEKQTVRLEVVAKGLETPWGIAFLPDGRMLVTERPGRLRIVDKGQLMPAVSGTPAVWVRQDGGMFDVEVHPDHARNGWIYLAYSEAGVKESSMTAVVRGRIKGNAWVDQQTIYKAPPELFYAENSHYGLRFAFDNRGHLFYSIGDRGHPDESQDLSSPIGKIHRVNDDGSAPRDNPFAGKAGVVATIWSYGHRNPQGLAFDPVTGRLWASEHGPMGGDELNRIETGRNYGWPVVSNGLQPGVTKSEQPGMESPVAHWTPAIGPAGMAFASSAQYPGWRNNLFLAALAGQHLRRFEIDGDRIVRQEVVFNEFGRVRDIVMGPDGYLYVSLSLPGQRLSDTTAGVVVRLLPVK